MVRIEPFRYIGKVWCLKVPTGCFVAVRNGMAFPTGNSGFPKSLDVSKAIDKQRTEDLQPAADVARWLVQQMEVRGIARRDICDHFQAENIAQQWTTHWIDGAVKPRVPKWDQWLELRRWLDLPDDMDTEVWRLNGRKGKPSDNFAEREVVGQDTKARSTSGKSALPTVGGSTVYESWDITAPATPEAQQWAGWGTALKPSFESVTWATKPVDPMGYCAIILENLTELEAQCLQNANAAASSSRPTQAGSPEAKIGFAQEPAATQHGGEQERKTATGAAGATSSPVDTSASTLAAASIAWSIASSWRHTLEGVYARGRTSTTETESKTTTDWKTLSCCLSQITPESIIQACSLPGGFSANASTAAQIFNASLASLQSTLTLSAIEPATWRALDASQAEAVSPSLEPVVMARKPLAGTVAACVLEHGTGALNVDGCRVPGSYETRERNIDGGRSMFGTGAGGGAFVPAEGRWPANLIHDGSEEPCALLADSARFFYTAKATRAERQGVTHPTVKPLDLMAYLCRLVTPPGGTVLDPFMGSGTTIKAALSEGFNGIGIERDPAYFAMAEQRLNGAQLGLALVA